MSPQSVAVCGGGPCGLAAALLLERQGHAVTLFERFTVAQPIGSGLMIQPTGLAVLAALGLAERIKAEGAQIDRLFGSAGRRTVLDVHYRALAAKGRFGVGLHRASLFAALFDAVRERPIAVECGRTVDSTRLVGNRRVLVFSDGSQAGPFDLVVDAMGTRTPLDEPGRHELAYGALWASLDWVDGAGHDPHALSQRYWRSSKMAGILPIGPGSSGRNRAAFFWSLRGDRHAAWQDRGLDVWKREVLDMWPATQPLLDQIVSPDQLTFARYSHRRLRAPAQPALVHIGDAWHSASPQLGQGANMALLDAWALGLAMAQAPTVDQAIGQAIALRQRHVAIYQALTWLFTPVYQSDSRVLPVLRDWLVGPLSKLWPATRIQAEMVAGTIGDPLRRLGLPVPY